MNAIRLPNGHLLIPRRAEGPDGLVGDGMVEITPDDPDYEKWLPFVADKVEPLEETPR